MWLQSFFDSLTVRTARQPAGRAKRTAIRRREARRLLLEGLEDRHLLAFNVLAEYATGPYPNDLALAQFTAGSQTDMVVADYYGGDVSVRLGGAGGTFGPAQFATAGLYPHSVATGDFDGGGTDLVTANSDDVSLLLGNGDGTFDPPQSISLPPQVAPGNPDPTQLAQSPRSVATGDINGDGKLDLVVLGTTFWQYCPWYCYSYQEGYVNVLLGDGTGGFGTPDVHHLGTNNSPSTVAVGDVNGDLKPDVITANNGYYTSGLTVLLNEADAPGELALGSPVHSGSGYALPSISLGDVDGDGNVDTLLGGGNGLYVQKGNGDGTFTSQPYMNAGGYVNSAVIGDVNDDGKMDLVAAGADNEYHCTNWGSWGCYSGYWTSSRHATVIMGDGHGNFAVPLTSSLGSDPGYDYLADLAIEDLTGDGKPELVTIDPNFDKAIVAFNDGDWNPPPSISISDAATVVEGDSGTVNAVFTVTIVTIVGGHGDVSVNYATGDYSTTAGDDYAITSGTLDFTAADSVKTISVPVKGDTIDEDDEWFFVSLSNGAGGQITDSYGSGKIQDDDTDPVLSISDAPTIVEGDSGTLNAVFTVTLAGDRKNGAVNVDYKTSDYSAAAGADYTATSGTLTFDVTESSKEISVPILDDAIDEYDEQFFVSLYNPVKAKISDSYGTGTIQDNDPLPSITIDNVSHNEGNNRHNTSFVFTVSLSAVSGKWVSVNYNTEDDSATVGGSDYYATSGTVYIAPGTLTGTITVTVRGDKTKEPNETFNVKLSGESNATIGDPLGIGTIVNDDGGRGGGGKPSSSLDTALLVDDTVSTIRKRR